MQVMASTFGDQSYPKLPPIRKGSLKQTQTNGRDKTNAEQMLSLNRKTHGLVRLPPIIRVDPLVSSKDFDVDYSHLEDADNTTENVSQQSSTGASPSKVFPRISSQCKKEEDFGRRTPDQPAKRQTIKKATSINNAAVVADFHLDQVDIQCPSISHFEIDKTSGDSRRDSKPGSLLNAHQTDKRRRSSLIVAEPVKLHRGRRMAKSSPDLSSTRKQYGSPVRGTRTHTHKTRTNSDLDSFNLIEGDFFTVEDYGNSGLKNMGKQKVGTRNLTQRHGLKRKGQFASQPQSSPCTPVLQLVNDEHNTAVAPREYRKSLGDIYGGSVGNSRERGIVANSGKILPGREGKGRDRLFVEGKTCPQNERLPARISSPRPSLISKDSLLKVPQSQIKRDSLYDLQQILSLLSLEKTDSTQVPSSSVYNLREFLETSGCMSDSASTSVTNTRITKQDEDAETNKLNVKNTEPRRGSTYDLMEFLNLNASAIKKAGTPAGENDVPSPPSQFLLPRPNQTRIPSVDIRRSSAYDLMEFLSLTGQNDGTVKIQSNQTESKPSNPSVSLTIPSSDPNQESTRKGSIYNLEEFLNLQRKSNSTTSVEAEGNPTANPFLSTRLPTRFKFKRESIYDLQEFLGILQKESDTKRQSDNSTEKDHLKDEALSVEHGDPKLVKENSMEGDSLKPSNDPHKNRSLSIYDLREFLSLYTAQSQPSTGDHLRRKPSQISQSSIMINVTEDEFGNGNVDDVFLAVPSEADFSARKRSSIASVAEFNDLLNIINDTTRKKNTNERGTPTPVSRHDSGGGKSLYDLGEFLSVLNSDDSPLRRRLSSVSGSRCPSSLSRNDSSGGSSLYDLEEFLAVLNETGQRKEGSEGGEVNVNAEIIIPVPQLPSRIDRNENQNPLDLSATDRADSITESN